MPSFLTLTQFSLCVSFEAPLVASIGHQDALLLATVAVRCIWGLVLVLSVARNVTVSAPGLARMILLMSLRFL
jgi:hypothetical protein